MLWMAIITPVIGAVYLVLQIHKRDLRGWQHYACLTSLVFLISIMFLIAGGRIESFGLGGNTVKLVDQKLDRIEALTEQNKQMAQKTVEMIRSALNGVRVEEGYDSAVIYQTATELLKAAGLSDREIRQVLGKGTNAP
jgi:hypothetical protein